MAKKFQKIDKISDNIIAAADQFRGKNQVVNIHKFGNGNINSTFLITLDSSTKKQFILQQINTEVFSQPELVMSNLRTFTEHISQRLESVPIDSNRRWEVPQVLSVAEKQDYWVDADGSFWRALSFIDSSQSFDTIKDREHAREVGYGLGMFHNLLSDLPTKKLADTLEGFHITPRYLEYYDRVLETKVPNQSPEINYCLKFVHERRELAYVLENAKTQGRLHLRPIHGDPKVNNILMDTTTGQAVSIIDLDTVKPGLIHYDIGDCLRSGCNSLGEETEHWEMIHFDTNLCESILQGYFSLARGFLTEQDYEYLYDGIRLLAFELGLRFLSDYLAGNIYFKARHKEHNLTRAIVQFKLTESIESQVKDIRAIIKEQIKHYL